MRIIGFDNVGGYEDKTFERTAAMLFMERILSKLTPTKSVDESCFDRK